MVSICKTRSQALTTEEDKHLVSSPLASILTPARGVRKKQVRWEQATSYMSKRQGKANSTWFMSHFKY
jgi:hypothetical protein